MAQIAMVKIPSPVDEDLIKEREYQVNIFEEIKDRDSLVVLPTGLGKTVIALYLICYFVEKEEKVILMSPTKPLCEQHLDFLRKSTSLDDDELVLITGELYGRDEREDLWEEEHRVFIATPQTVNNDLNLVPRSNIGLIVFDEVHRAVGDYAYAEIAKACKNDTRYLGLTASPGSSFEKLIEVCYNLGIETVEVRTEDDEDVKPYVSDKRSEWIEIDKPDEVVKMERWLDTILQGFIDDLSDYTGRLNGITAKDVGKTALIEIQEDLQKRIKSGDGNKGYLFHALSLTSASIKVTHLKELLLTQGIDPAHRYVLQLQEDDDRSSKYVKKKEEFDRLSDVLLDLKAMPVETNPKLTQTKQILREELGDKRAMVFAQYRDTVDLLLEELNHLEDIRPGCLIGQADKKHDKGMSQDEQKETLEKYREGVYNVLVCTRIGEEGLDIPATELVIFYEPVPSAIRSIQRKGRTGRDERPGKVYILITEETKDEAFYWKSINAEKDMFDHVYRLKRKLECSRDPKKILERLMDEEVREQSALDQFS